ncbi:MAG TPA: hypothetical protein VFT50_05570 [Baekduia sp.]|nr:hypothetical protein [Baekduia sp.]
MSLPTPPRERWPLALALLTVAAGVALLAVALGQLGGGNGARAAAAPPTPPAVVVATPAAAVVGPPAPAVAGAPAPQQVEHVTDERRFAQNDQAHVRASWVAGFYDIYAEAQRVFGVNWLLIASVHKQETAFSTHPTTYHGRNFAGCCAGPMQFNVTNGPTSTWDRYRNAGAVGTRPAGYPHPTRRHPSIYDDYDAIMAAAELLRDSGAGRHLDASAWRAAYDYYGHDLTGVAYANEVLARAIGWGQRHFCINCGTDPGILAAVDAAWGAPVRAEMTAAADRERAAQRRAAHQRDRRPAARGG